MTRAHIDRDDFAFADAPDRACANRPDLDWFPGQGSTTYAVRELAAVCHACPHLEPCREWAIHHEPYGVWAGLSQIDRIRIRRARGITLAQPQAAA